MDAVWGRGGVHDVVWLIRLPRLVLAAATGAGLGLCGAVMQAMVQNTMADPYILGVSSGAYLGAALALTAGAGTALGGSAMGLAGAVGAFLAAAPVLLLSRLGGRSTPLQLLLSVLYGDILAVRHRRLGVLGVLVKIHTVFLLPRAPQRGRAPFAFDPIVHLFDSFVKREISTLMTRVLIFCERSVNSTAAPRPGGTSPASGADSRSGTGRYRESPPR